MYIHIPTHHLCGLFLLFFCITVLTGCGPKGIDTKVETKSTLKNHRILPKITAGIGHTCVATNRGRVECRGMNRFGQLGRD